jgi:plastocyanin
MIPIGRMTAVLFTMAVAAAGVTMLPISTAATSVDMRPEESMLDDIMNKHNSTQTGDSAAGPDETRIAANTGRVVTKQGTMSSPGAQAGPFQVIDILPAREDGRVYVGWITFTATQPVMVAPFQTYGVANETFGTEFGDLFVFPGGPNGTLIAPALIAPQYEELPESQIPMPETYSAAVPFAGNGLAVGNLNGESFLISYTLHAVTYAPEVTNNVDSAITNQTEVNGTRVSIVPGAAFLNDTAFDPNPVTVQVGENVTWVNDDPDPHTVTSGSIGAPDAGEEFDSGYMGPNRAFSHRFDAAGEYDYFCIIHPNMVGTVVVEE